MTRDDALFIARRIMDRNREDGAEHLDSIADEILAGEAIIEGKRKPFIVADVDVSNLKIEPGAVFAIPSDSRTMAPVGKMKLIEISTEMDEWLANWIKNRT